MKKDDVINLLIIGSEEWCTYIKNSMHFSKKYHLLSVSDFKAALHRLKHNSYDILILQELCFKYRSLNLSLLSYAMSRPSVILCNSVFRYFVYQIWKHFSNWTTKYKLAKLLIHIKMYNKKSTNLMDNFFKLLIKQHKNLNAISKEIRSNFTKF